MMDVKQLDLFPTQPGVYLMRDRAGNVLYVGKANNLRQRVKQYFAVGGDGRPMVPFLIVKVVTIDTIVVTSEKEALLLENTLVKTHLPPYNVCLKDDKTYISLKINNRHPWPMVQLVRYKGRPPQDGLYFGPYTSALSARHTFDLINKIFPLRQCSDQELMRRTRPCILYQMKRCIAPCVGMCTKEEYDHQVQRTVQFLRGQDKELLKDLYTEMQKAAETLEFEHAEEILRVVRSIELTLEKQSVHKVAGNDADVWAIFRQAEELVITQMAYRHGKLIAAENHSFSGIAQDDEEILQSFLLQHYELMEEVPHEVLVPIQLPEASALAELLEGISHRRVLVLAPQRGEKLKLIEMAYSNAEAAFRRSKDERAIREKTLLEMQDKLHLTRYPKKIECFDNSHLSGSQQVSALVTFVEGEKETKGYRTYRMRATGESDDYGAMREVLTRRYGKAKEEDNLPDLLIIDGGKAHLNVAIKVFEALDIASVDLISIAKEAGRHDKGMTEERVFLREMKDPVLLRNTSPILFLLQRIRDEAHRFVLKFQTKRRTKVTIASELVGIPGIGPKKRKALLTHFGSVKVLRQASEEQLREVSLLSSKDVEVLVKWMNKR